MTDQIAAQTAAGNNQLVIRVAQRSDVGLVRTENQDFAIQTTAEEEMAGKGRLLIVADGMGGHRGGATASRLAATTIKSEYLADAAGSIPQSLKSALERANAKIFAEAQQNPDLRGMGTTCSALVVEGDEAFVAHVGDSRIYLVRAGEIQQLTQDHSLVASMVREGLLTVKEAEVHPRRNVLQRSMGVTPEVEVDLYPSVKVQPGDTFILCSDGLHGLVKEPEMLEVATLPIDDAANEFVRRAIQRGAPDNVTVIVARVEEQGIASENLVAEEMPTVDSTPTTAETPAAIPPTLKVAKAVGEKKEAKKRGPLFKWIAITLLVLGLGGAAVVFWSLRQDVEASRQHAPR